MLMKVHSSHGICAPDTVADVDYSPAKPPTAQDSNLGCIPDFLIMKWHVFSRRNKIIFLQACLVFYALEQPVSQGPLDEVHKNETFEVDAMQM